MHRLFNSIVFSVVLIFCVSSYAAKVVYDFSDTEDAQEFKKFDLPNVDNNKLEISNKFASPGTNSLHFYTPKWQEGMNKWPSFNLYFDNQDWTEYDRVVVEITNASEYDCSYSSFISESKTQFRNGLKARDTISPFSSKSNVVDIKSPELVHLWSKVNWSNVSIWHFYIQTPLKDTHLYVNRVYLLKKGEDVLPIDDTINKQTESGLKRNISSMLETGKGAVEIKKVISRLENEISQISPEDNNYSWLKSLLDQSKSRFAEVQALVELGKVFRDDDYVSLCDKFDNLSVYAYRVKSLEKFRSEYQSQLKKYQPGIYRCWSEVGVATASSMQKVMPRDVALPGSIESAKEVNLSLAKNENEGFQIVVIPFVSDINDVRIEIGEFENSQGQLLSPESVEAEVVGYVKTYLPQHTLYNKGQYVGWWPDPLLDFINKTDIEAGIAQSFFIRIKTGKDTKQGVYDGKVTVLSSSIKGSFEIDVSVTVYDFILPDKSPLPVIMSFNPDQIKKIMSFAESNFSESMWDEKWQSLKFQWADFLADYYLGYDSLYLNSPSWPDYEVIEYLNNKGKLDIFNLGNIGNDTPEKVSEIEGRVERVMPNIKAAYKKAKDLELLDKTYIYGFDERQKQQFEMMDEIAAEMKSQIPGVEVMTTAGAYWDYWGDADNIDMWCPIIGKYNKAKADKLRKEGKKTWWYICIASGPPYPNVYIDMDVIDSRVMMGAMTAKYRPDGFLYYAINIWNHWRAEKTRNPNYITSGPFTTWNPKSFAESHGDGNMTYPGPGCRPLANLRLENFRDGLDDYAYYRILEETIKTMESFEVLKPIQVNWLKQAKDIMVIPTEVVKSTSDFTKDPYILKAYRDTLARYIVSAPGIEPEKLD